MSVLFFTVVLYRAIERVPNSLQIVVAIGGLGLAYFDGEFLAGMPFGIGLAVPCLAFVLAGRLLQVIEPRLTNPLVIGILLVFSAGVAIASIPQQFVDLKVGLFGTPGVGVAIAVAAGTGMILIARRFPLGTHVSKLAIRLGVVGIAVVLAHPVVIWAFRTHDVMPKWTLLAAVVLPWTVAMLLTLTPLSALLVGTKKDASRRARKSAASEHFREQYTTSPGKSSGNASH
ncbi:hypothetical protein E3T31_15365 [Cryobacterium sp. TMS1-13-1]|nr:hypothetical protein E3T31_15365 [Cryobacterium sp. TMS1-13-1]